MDTYRSFECIEQEATRRTLAGLLAQRRLGFFDRLAARARWRLGRWNAYWSTLSRRGRRAVGRRLAPALLGASLLAGLVMVPAPAAAAGIIADGTICTIVEAIQSAESDTAVGGCASGSGADVITMTAGATLTTSSGYYANDDTGLPQVTTAITIEGGGHAIARDSAAPDFSILAVSNTGDLTLNDVTISGGRITSFYSSGGGIYNNGLLTLNDSVVSGNYAYSTGGGISNGGTLVLNGSLVSYNAANHDGGGINGGGTTLTDSIVSHNTAGRGGGIRASGDLVLINSTVSDNQAGAGGGITHFGSQLTLTDSTVGDNTAAGNGGGIEKRYGHMTATRSTISGNSAGAGGGIHIRNFTQLTVINSTVSGNSATGKGGGVYTYTGDINLNSSTISNNSAGGEGGGFYNLSVADVNDSLISGNTASGAGDEVSSKVSFVFFREYDTVFGHSGLTTADAIVGFTPIGSNVTATSDGSDPTPLSSILSPLADNGGPTLTHALVSGSPAIDHVVYTHCVSYSILGGVDQRGEPRNVDGDGSPSPNTFECDAGSYEFQGTGGGSQMLFVSPRISWQAGGVRVHPQDILAHDPSTDSWEMHFDGSDVGVTRPLAAFARMADGSWLLAFTGPTNLPGVSGVTTNDVVRFVPSSLGDMTAGTFEWYFDGSDVGLAAVTEKIDALDALADGRLLISPSGNTMVPAGMGLMLSARDEDLLAFNPSSTGQQTTGRWTLHFDGSAVSGLAAENVTGAHLDEATGDIYLSLFNDFVVGGQAGNAKDILKLSPAGEGFAVELFWRGPEHGFALDLAGVEIE